MAKSFHYKKFGQIFWTIGEQFISSFTIFVIGVLLARATTKNDFGMYIFGLSIVMILIGFQRAIITTPYIILFGQLKENEKGKYRYASFVFQKIFLIISFIFFIIVIVFFYVRSLYDYLIFFMFLYIFFIGQMWLYYFKYILIGELKVKKNFFYCISIYFSSLFFLMILFFFGKLNTYNTYLSVGLLTILISIFFYFSYFKLNLIKVPMNQIKAFFFEHWKLGKWILGSNIGFMFSSQLFPWVLLYFWGKSYVAELGIVLSVTRILAPAIQGFWSFLLPNMTIYTNNKEKFTLLLKRLTFFMFIISYLLISFGYFFGDYIVEILYSSKYSGLGILITLGFVLQSISLINMPIDAGLNALKRTDVGFFSLVISVIVTIIIGFPLTYKYGTYGALMGMILASMTGVIYRLYKLIIILKKGI